MNKAEARVRLYDVMNVRTREGICSPEVLFPVSRHSYIYNRSVHPSLTQVCCGPSVSQRNEWCVRLGEEETALRRVTVGTAPNG